MRAATLVLCCLTAALWCSTAVAAEKKKATVYEGWIAKTTDKSIVMDVPKPDGKSERRIFYCNEQTTYTVNGKSATHGDLAKGMAIRLTPKTKNIAASVEAVTVKKKSW